MFKLFVILLALSSINGQLLGRLPRIDTKLGRVVGFKGETVDGNPYYGFEGVPYAQPPVGNLRFEEPRPVKPWGKRIRADKTVSCLQYNHYNRLSNNKEYEIEGQEDCLFLNIYTSNISANANLDVLVFLHLGGFMFGSGNTSPSYLLQRRMVLVNVAYRLGPLGFLSTEDDIVPGNNGLKDQNMALKWIQANIKSFGGNPKSVTIWGFSAGGASVIYHLLSPLSRNLFQKAYAISGSALNPWAQADNSLEKAKRLAESVNCTTGDTKSMVDCMKSVPGKELLRNIQLFQDFLYNPISPFGPVVEKGGQNPFLSESPLDLFNKKNQVYDVPLISSMTVDEGLYPTSEFLSDPSFLEEVNTNWDKYAPSIFNYKYTVPLSEQSEVSQAIYNEYYYSGDSLSNPIFHGIAEAVGDRLYKTAIEKTAKLMAQVKNSPTYLINFGFCGRFNSLFQLNKSNYSLGVPHAAEMIYYFNHLNYPLNRAEKHMQSLLLNMVWDFIKNGDVKIGNHRLEPVSGGDYLEYLHIENPDNIRMKTAFSLSNSDFWNSLPFNENIPIVSLTPDCQFSMC